MLFLPQFYKFRFPDLRLIECFLYSAQVKVFVTGLFSLNQDIPAFKEHLRDFLVQIKVRKWQKKTTCQLETDQERYKCKNEDDYILCQHKTVSSEPMSNDS